MKILERYPDWIDVILACIGTFIVAAVCDFTMRGLYIGGASASTVTIFSLLVWQLKQVIRFVIIGFLSLVVAMFFFVPKLSVMSTQFFGWAGMLVLYVYLFVTGFRTKQ